jgi:hypothetical protein
VMTDDFTSIKVIYGVSWREFEMFGNLIWFDLIWICLIINFLFLLVKLIFFFYSINYWFLLVKIDLCMHSWGMIDQFGSILDTFVKKRKYKV